MEDDSHLMTTISVLALGTVNTLKRYQAWHVPSKGDSIFMEVNGQWDGWKVKHVQYFPNLPDHVDVYIKV